MNKEPQQVLFVSGFSLVEILIVISILSAMSFFLVQNFTRDIRTTLLNQSAARVLDIKRASLSYFVNSGSWPNAHGHCHGAAEQLRPILGSIGLNPWGYPYEFECPLIQFDQITADEENDPVRPSLQVKQQVPSRRVAQLLAGRLPSSEVRQLEQSIVVISYIPMALLPSGVDHSNQLTRSSTSLTFRVIHCPRGKVAAAVLIPSSICVKSNQGLFGFRLGTEDTGESRRSKTVLFDIQERSGRWVNGFTACAEVKPRDAVRIYQYCAG